MSTHDTRRLYFAYGSNLNISQMLGRCETAIPVSRFSINNWKLVFKCVADVIPCNGSIVHGALYDVGPDDISALDYYEGINHGLYRRVEFSVKEAPTKAFFYVMNDDNIYPPHDRYLQSIADGYRDWRISLDTLEEAVKHAWSNMMAVEEFGNVEFDDVITGD